MKKYWFIITTIIISTFLISCNDQGNHEQASVCIEDGCQSDEATKESCAGCPSANGIKELAFVHEKVISEKPLITFIELGSVNCVPCKKMQPVMKAIEEKYTEQIEVIFYDVWKAEQRKYAEIYGIRLIPTQVFLDLDGNEIFRHEGFFPEEEIDQFLQKQGLKPKQEI